MRITIKTIDGGVQSTEVSRESFEAEIDKEWDAMNEWQRGRSTKRTYEQEVEKVSRMFEEFSSLSYISLDIDGKTVYFNPTNVIWATVEP